MFKVVKCFEFEAAHQLIDTCTEKCKQVHGHTYKLEIELSAQELGPDNMVMDFTEISRMVKELLEEFDHKLILKSPKELNASVAYAKEDGVVFLKEQPTAEYMCRLFFALLAYKTKMKITRVRLWETSNSYAEYLGC